MILDRFESRSVEIQLEHDCLVPLSGGSTSRSSIRTIPPRVDGCSTV
jgi:hypothetical protein